MTRRNVLNVRKQGWVFPLFFPDSDDQLRINLHRFVILNISCDTRSLGLGQYCLPKVSNGFKEMVNQTIQNMMDINIKLRLNEKPCSDLADG